MYTVVVADDEEELRTMLIRRIEWEKLGYKFIGEASNGAEALELVEKLEPDLLITDIKMPFISGIELAREVREVRPNTQIVFLSGFDDFTYAQQAIQYNIISYLLKPISSEEISVELTKIKQIMDQKFEEFYSISKSIEHVNNAELFLPIILGAYRGEGHQTNDKLMQLAEESGFIGGEGTEYVRFAVMVTTFKDENGKDCTSRSSINPINTILGKYVKYVSFYIDGRVVSLLSSTERGFRKYLHILTEEIVQSTRRILQEECSIGLSRVIDTIIAGHECYLDAVNALDYATQAGNVNFITNQERTNELPQEKVEEFIGGIERYIRGGTEEQLEVWIKDFFVRFDRDNISYDILSFVIVQTMSSIFKVVYAVVGETAIRELKDYSPIRNISMFQNTNDAYTKYLDLCVKAKQLISEQLKKSSDIICSQALSIIENEFAEPEISLVSVSDKIAVSPNYLSALLKKTTGITFVEHLSNRRMKEAKYLLINTPMKIREIAEKCGYNDQHYFSYSFKKVTGQSPNCFRRPYEE